VQSTLKKPSFSILGNQNGYVLYTVLIVLVLLGILLGVVFKFTMLDRRLMHNELYRMKARYAAEAGVEKAKYFLSGNEGKSILWVAEKYEEKVDSNAGFSFSVRPWGGYIEVISEGYCLKQTQRVRALLAQCQNDMFANAITNLDSSGNMIVAGRTSIIGDVQLITGDVRKSAIPALPYKGQEPLVQGNVEAIKRLPVVNTALLDVSFNRFPEYFKTAEGTDQLVTHSLVFDGERADLSPYKNKTVYIEGSIEFNLRDSSGIDESVTFVVERSVFIKNNSCLHNVNFIARERIEIGQNAQVNKALLFSNGTIDIGGQSRVQAQVLSKDSITIHGNAILAYPSFVYNSGKVMGQSLVGGIKILDSAFVSGAVVYNRIAHDDRLITYKSPNKLEVGKSAVIKGIVFCNTHCLFQGRMLGHITTQSFIYSKGGTTYRNWLVDSYFNREEGGHRLVLPVIFGDKPDLITLVLQEL